MSQAVEGTYTTAVDTTGRQHGNRTRVRRGRRARESAMSARDRRSLVWMAALMPVAMVMIAAPVYVVLGEKGIAGSPSLWNLALDVCRVITGLFGLFVLGSVCRDGARTRVARTSSARSQAASSSSPPRSLGSAS